MLAFSCLAMAGEKVTLSQIKVCESDEDCVIVPYAHCCGSTRQAINRKYKDMYDANPQWQKFNDPDICAIIGQCQDDSNFDEAWCREISDLSSALRPETKKECAMRVSNQPGDINQAEDSQE